MKYVVWIEYKDDDGFNHAHRLYPRQQSFEREEAIERAKGYLRSLTRGPESEIVRIIPQCRPRLQLDFANAERITINAE